MTEYGRGAFGGNQTYITQEALNAGRVTVHHAAGQPISDGASATVARDLPSFGWGNVVTVPAGANMQVLPATNQSRLVIVQNIGLIPVYITNNAAIAPFGIRVGCMERWEGLTNQSVTLSAALSDSYFGEPIVGGLVAVTG